MRAARFRQRLHHLDRPLARRIDQQLVGAREVGDLACVEQIRNRVLRGKSVALGIRHGAPDQSRVPFDAVHQRAAPGDRQGEVAKPTEQVEHALSRSRREQSDCPSHQHTIDRVIDLGEVGGQESDIDTEILDPVVERRRFDRVKQACAFRPRALQPDLHAMRIGKSAQLRFVGRSRRHQHAEHEYRGGLADGNLHLRQPLGDRQRIDEGTQRQDQARHVRRQDLARVHDGDVARAAFVETHQRAALLLDPARRQPRPMTIAPCRPDDRREHALGLHFAHVREGVFEHALLGRHLRAEIDVLQRAAAAHAEVRTARTYARRTGPDDARDPTAIEARLALHGLELDLLTGQRALDEDDLALEMRDAPPQCVERLDGRDARVFIAHQPRPGFHAARNSCQCLPFCLVSVARTSSVSDLSPAASSAPRICWKARNTRCVFTTSVSQ